MFDGDLDPFCSSLHVGRLTALVVLTLPCNWGQIFVHKRAHYSQIKWQVKSHILFWIS